MRELVGSADRLLDAWEPDYRRPVEQVTSSRTSAAAQFLEACRAGDKRSCWMAMTLVDASGWQAAAALVERNCRAGDLMSCRALPAEHHKLVFADAPGEVGRSWRCSQFNQVPACDLLGIASMRSECAAGFVASCWNLEFAQPPLPDRVEIGARIAGLAQEGCEQGLVDDCRALVRHATGDLEVLASERLCALVGEHCPQLATARVERGEPVRARDALERGCQHPSKATLMVCLELGQGYLDAAYPEPVAGRGQALVDWACGEIARTITPQFARTTPGCLRTTSAAAE